MYLPHHLKTKLFYTWAFVCCGLLFTESSSAQSATSSPAKLISIKLDLQEAQIIDQLMQQIELSTQEVPIYLAIYKPLEQITAGKTRTSKQQVVLKLTGEDTKNLILFLQRANIPSLGAKQVDIILKKVQKSLPKDDAMAKPATDKAAKKVDKIGVRLSALEIALLQQMLGQIEITISELSPFLDVYLPIEQANEAYVKAPINKDIVLDLPSLGPKNLLIFLERITLTGKQAKIAYGLIDKLQQVLAASASAPHLEQ